MSVTLEDKAVSKDPNAGRPGYKETKVGWIPEKWEEATIGSTMDSSRVSLTTACLLPSDSSTVYFRWPCGVCRRVKFCLPVKRVLLFFGLIFSAQRVLSADHPEIVDRMSQSMLALRREMIDEGGDWYEPR